MGKGAVAALLNVLLVASLLAQPIQFPYVLDTPIEPQQLPEQPRARSIADAVRANDYEAFASIYREEGEPAAYRELYRVWTYAMTDRMGAFFDAETRNRIAARYPRYAQFIEQHRIVDANGNAFYPTAETRSFLFEQALADVRPAVRDSEPRVARSTPTPTAKRTVAPRPQRARKLKAEVAPGGGPLPSAAPSPAVMQAPPKAAEGSGAPQVVAQPAAPVVQANVIAAQPQSSSRGILLVVVALVVLGVLSMLLRMPGEQQVAIFEPKKPPVETITFPPAEETKRRANGSRG